jgi:transcriptional regulator with XRE-family HTH domain
MEYREYIASRRKKLGLSQGDLASALGYTDTAISKIESGMSSPPISVLPLLADQLKVKLVDLLKMNENPEPFEGTNPPFLAENVGHNIRAIRLHLHLRQGEAAERIGVSKRTLITYEKGDACPSLAVLETILRDCPEDPEAFFYGVLYPDIQASSSFQKRGPNPFFFSLVGLLFGAAVASAIILPVTLSGNAGSTTSNGSFAMNTSIGDTSSTSATSTSSSHPIAGLNELKVITSKGLAGSAPMKPGTSLDVSVYTGDYPTHDRESKLSFSLSLGNAISGVSLSTNASDTSMGTVSVASSVAYGTVFVVKVQASLLSDPTVIQTGDALEITD